MIKNAPRITLAAACSVGLFATIAVAGPSTTPGAPVLSTSGGISSPRNLISPEAEIVVKPSEDENSQLSEGVLSLTPANGIVPPPTGPILPAAQSRLDLIANGTGGAVDFLSGGINIISLYLAQY